jgi:hypothetical protein
VTDRPHIIGIAVRPNLREIRCLRRLTEFNQDLAGDHVTAVDGLALESSRALRHDPLRRQKQSRNGEAQHHCDGQDATHQPSGNGAMTQGDYGTVSGGRTQVCS